MLLELSFRKKEEMPKQEKNSFTVDISLKK